MLSAALVVFLITIAKEAGSEKAGCGKGFYYDSVIARCDTCHTICDYADIQRTLDACRDECPGFTTTATTETTAGHAPVTCSTERRTVLVLSLSLLGISGLLLALMAAVIIRETRWRWEVRHHAGYRDQNTESLLVSERISASGLPLVTTCDSVSVT